MKDKRKVYAQGVNFRILIQRCANQGVRLMKIEYISDYELSFFCYEEDYSKVEKAAGNGYKLTTCYREGPGVFLKQVAATRKTTVLGILLFLFLIFYQNLFVSEIKIEGCETIKEEVIQEALQKCGLYEGCRKDHFDPEDTEYMLYELVEGIAWAEVRIRGGLVTVDIAESEQVEKKAEQEDVPTHVVAKKEGMIEQIIARKGTAAVQKGDYVTPGAILISGHSSVKEGEITWLEHAQGEVYARIVYILHTEISLKEEEKEVTGRFFPGIRLKLGDMILDTEKLFSSYEAAVVNECSLINTVKPLPIELSLLGINEAQIRMRDRTEKEIQYLAEKDLLLKLREEIPEDARIAEQRITLSPEADTVKATGVFDVIEQIGETREMTEEEMADQRGSKEDAQEQ